MPRPLGAADTTPMSSVSLALAFAIALLVMSLAWTGRAELARNMQMRPAASDLPSGSLYRLDVPLETHAGERTTLSAGAGAPRVVGLFRAGCDITCPLTFDAVRALEASLAPEARARLSVVLVSLDSRRDSPAVLAELARSRGIETNRWMLARAPEHAVESLSSALGIRSRRLADGSLDHSSRIALLSSNGRVLASMDIAGGVDPAFTAAVIAATDR